MGDPLSRDGGGGGSVGGRPREAVLLCGGRGTRLGGGTEKPLVEVGGRPMVDRVIGALAGSRVERVVAVPSPHAPETTRVLRRRLAPGSGMPIEVVVGSGDGYVADLERGLAAVDGPAVSVVADLPLLRARDVDDAIDASVALGGSPGTPSSLSVCVPAALKRDLGASVDAAVDSDGRELAPTGLNVVADGDDERVVWDRESVAINVNRPGDLDVARGHVRDA